MLKMLSCASMKDPKNAKFEGEDSDEKILYIFRRARITNLGWLAVTFLLIIAPAIARNIITANLNIQDFLPSNAIFVSLIFWYTLTFGYVWYNFLNWFFNLYIVTNKRVIDIDFHGLLYKNISESPLENIEDVTSNISGVFRVIFNFGSVYIQTAAEQREFEFHDVARPTKVRDIVSDIVTNLTNRN